MTGKDFITIDGRMGEGGGQVLRGALALSLALGRPFRISDIRANRPKPGLKRQHLTCVLAAAEICGAEVEGAEMKSTGLTFRPGPVRPGNYRFPIGSGGSVTLVLQAVLPPLMLADGPSTVEIIGGTHVPFAPVYDYFERTLAPMLAKIGPGLKIGLHRPGFMDVGGGVVRVEVTPVRRLGLIDATVPGETESLTGRIVSYNLPEVIGQREEAVISQKLRDLTGLRTECLAERDCGPGNYVLLELKRSTGTTITSGIAQLGLPAEKVARAAVSRMLSFLSSRAAVDVCLADQLIVPMALAGGGRLLTEKPSLHLETVMELASLFTGKNIEATRAGDKTWLVEVK